MGAVTSPSSATRCGVLAAGRGGCESPWLLGALALESWSRLVHGRLGSSPASTCLWDTLCCMGLTGANWALSTQPDLISTIGESAALGAAGVIFWGDVEYTKNRVGLSSAQAPAA